MNVSLGKKVVTALVLVAASGLMIGLAPSIGQEAKKADKKLKGRLPAYYADIVTEDQKTKIYSIQAKHAEKIAELTASLAAANKTLNDEIEGVLTAEQKAKLKAAQDEAAAKKKKSATDKKAADDAKKTGAAAETKTTKSTAKPK